MHCVPSGLLAAALSLLTLGCAAAPEAPRELRVVSYNIRHGAGLDGKVDLERTAAALRALRPDVVALQEVDDGVARSGKVDEPALLGQALGMEHAFTSFLDYQGGRYGLAMLSRLPIRARRTIPLPPGDEPREALAVEVETEDGSAFTVVCVHFNWVADDAKRFDQATELCAHLDRMTTPWIVAGDYNDLPGSRTLALFDARARAAAKADDARLTFPADAPVREIDYVHAWPRSRWDVVECRAVDERMASDHRPVLAVLRLLPGP